MPINLTISGENAREVITELLTFSDFYVNPSRRVGVTVEKTDTSDLVAERDASVDRATSGSGQKIIDGLEEAVEHAKSETTFREFGKAPEGKTRRTKEEIAEDERAQELAEKHNLPMEMLENNIRRRGHAAVIADLEELSTSRGADQANISDAPEDRQDPENPADAEQDAADEQAEVDAARDPEAPLTLDDLRSAMNEFVEAKGMPTTQKEGPSIFEKALGKPPAGEAAWKLSLLNDATQEQLKAAIAAWKEAANGKG